MVQSAVMLFFQELRMSAQIFKYAKKRWEHIKIIIGVSRTRVRGTLAVVYTLLKRIKGTPYFFHISQC